MSQAQGNGWAGFWKLPGEQAHGPARCVPGKSLGLCGGTGPDSELLLQPRGE